MRVLHIGKYFPPVKGGIETHVRDLCMGLAKKGMDVTCVVSADKSSVENFQGIKLIRIADLFSSRHPFNLGLVPFLKRNHFDIVHLHMPNPCAEVSCLLAKPKRLVVSYHADIVSKFGSSLYLPFQRKVLRMAEKILVSSDSYANNSSVLKPFLHKCVVVPYGIDAKKFSSKSDVDVSRPLFLFVGRLVPYKGLKYLVQAMKRVDGTLIVAGNGPLLSKLRSQVKKLGLDSRVRILVDVSDDELSALYNACDVFVLPSVTRAESFGIVQLEAMACGKPVISTVDFVNVHGRTGLVVPPKGVDSLSKAMNTLGVDKKLRLRLGRYSKRLVEKEFTVEKMIDRVLRVYQS